MLVTRWILMVMVVASVVVGGCEKKEEKKSPVIPSAGLTPTPAVESRRPVVVAPPRVSSLKAADEKDDPRFALLFPASEKVEGWIKTSPVTGGDFRTQVGTYLPNLAAALMPFSGETLATAKYERMHQNQIERVTVCLVRAASGEDAYGMMSASAPSVDQYKQSEVRRRPTEQEIYAVKGPYFGIFTGQTDGADNFHLIAGLDLLAGKMLFEMPERAEVPRVVQYLQSEQLPAGVTLFVRNLESLKGPGGKEVLALLGAGEVAKMNKRLRLGPKTDFAVVVFKNPNWPTPDVIWLAEYPTREQALEVARQYRIALKARSAGPLDANTLIKGPKGRFLLGTWTLETESMTTPHLMNQIQTYLP